MKPAFRRLDGERRRLEEREPELESGRLLEGVCGDESVATVSIMGNAAGTPVSPSAARDAVSGIAINQAYSRTPSPRLWRQRQTAAGGSGNSNTA